MGTELRVDTVEREVKKMRCTCGAGDEFAHLGTCPTKSPATFEGGARRSEHKPSYYMVDRELLEFAGNRMEEGRVSHGRHNYRSGGPEFVKETFNHLIDHAFRFKEGDNAPEDLRAMAANIQILCWHFVNKPENFKMLWGTE